MRASPSGFLSSHQRNPSPSGSIAAFTFVESILALSLAGVFLALMWATVGFMLGRTAEGMVRLRGHLLAVEGIEQVMALRQTSVSRSVQDGFYAALGAHQGPHVLVPNGQGYSLEPGRDERITFDEVPFGLYCRTVFLEGVLPHVRTVRVQVSWGHAENCTDAPTSIAYSTQLYSLTP